jgi:hypothetical protein
MDEEEKIFSSNMIISSCHGGVVMSYEPMTYDRTLGLMILALVYPTIETNPTPLHYIS